MIFLSNIYLSLARRLVRDRGSPNSKSQRPQYLGQVQEMKQILDPERS